MDPFLHSLPITSKRRFEEYRRCARKAVFLNFWCKFKLSKTSGCEGKLQAGMLSQKRLTPLQVPYASPGSPIKSFPWKASVVCQCFLTKPTCKRALANCGSVATCPQIGSWSGSSSILSVSMKSGALWKPCSISSAWFVSSCAVSSSLVRP